MTYISNYSVFHKGTKIEVGDVLRARIPGGFYWTEVTSIVANQSSLVRGRVIERSVAAGHRVGDIIDVHNIVEVIKGNK